eukprot:SAG11_NODE_34434_length_272_cov_0.589595_1_plen_57_part_01
MVGVPPLQIGIGAHVLRLRTPSPCMWNSEGLLQTEWLAWLGSNMFRDEISGLCVGRE